MNNAAPAKPKAKALSRRTCARCGVPVSDDDGGGGGGDVLPGAGLGTPSINMFETAKGPEDLCVYVSFSS